MVRRSPEDPFAEQHEWYRHVEGIDIALAETHRAEEQPVSQLETPAAERLELLRTVAVRLLDQNAEATAIGGPNHCVGELGEIVLTQLRNREPDDARSSRPETACREIGTIGKFSDGAQDALTCLGSDMRVLVDDVRDGLDRDPRQPGDVVQRGPH
jgi:hypothetical protein